MFVYVIRECLSQSSCDGGTFRDATGSKIVKTWPQDNNLHIDRKRETRASNDSSHDGRIETVVHGNICRLT